MEIKKVTDVTWIRIKSHHDEKKVVIANADGLSSKGETALITRALATAGCKPSFSIKIGNDPKNPNEELYRIEIDETLFKEKFPEIIVPETIVGPSGGKPL